MLSRVAENLYWIGRYIERAESTARLINVNTNLLLDLPRSVEAGWTPLVAITGSLEAYEEKFDNFDERTVVRFLVSDPQNPASILASLMAARENVRTARDAVPREAWEYINGLYLFSRDHQPGGLSKRGRYAYLGRIIAGTQALTGLLLGNMTHDEGYQFVRLGRLIERADMTTRIIDVRSNSLLPDVDSNLLPFETIQWISVLKSLSAYQAYRLKRQTRVRRADALDFLLKSPEFPRAVNCCVVQCEQTVAPLPNHDETLQSLNGVKRRLELVNSEELANSQAALHHFVDEIQLGLVGVHEVVNQTWFRAN
jgi:uncharacterized alpha-E superfamily protein